MRIFTLNLDSFWVEGRVYLGNIWDFWVNSQPTHFSKNCEEERYGRKKMFHVIINPFPLGNFSFYPSFWVIFCIILRISVIVFEFRAILLYWFLVVSLSSFTWQMTWMIKKHILKIIMYLMKLISLFLLTVTSLVLSQLNTIINENRYWFKSKKF